VRTVDLNRSGLVGTLNYRACYGCVNMNDDGYCKYDHSLKEVIHIIDDKIYCEMFKEEE